MQIVFQEVLEKFVGKKMLICEDDETRHLPYEAVSCCKYPVLMDKSTTTGVEESGLWATGWPDLKGIHT